MALSNKKSPNSQPYRMLILAPYDGFEIMINKVIADRKDILADVYQAPVDHVEAVLSGLNLNKYEVVICRGRSSYIASQIVDLPVVTVEFSPMDILRGLRLAAEEDGICKFLQDGRNDQIPCQLYEYSGIYIHSSSGT